MATVWEQQQWAVPYTIWLHEKMMMMIMMAWWLPLCNGGTLLRANNPPGVLASRVLYIVSFPHANGRVFGIPPVDAS